MQTMRRTELVSEDTVDFNLIYLRASSLTPKGLFLSPLLKKGPVAPIRPEFGAGGSIFGMKA